MVSLPTFKYPSMIQGSFKVVWLVLGLTMKIAISIKAGIKVGLPRKARVS